LIRIHLKRKYLNSKVKINQGIIVILIFYLFFILLLGSGCHTKNHFYPNIIIRKGLEKEYNKAMWILYCVNTKHIARRHLGKKLSNFDTLMVPFLDAKLFSVVEFEDTIEMHFCFYHEDTNDIYIPLSRGSTFDYDRIGLVLSNNDFYIVPRGFQRNHWISNRNVIDEKKIFKNGETELYKIIQKSDIKVARWLRHKSNN